MSRVTAPACCSRKQSRCSSRTTTGVRAITVRHNARQVYATNGGKAAIEAWIASRGDWPGALLCPVVKDGKVQQRMGATAVRERVRTIAKQAGVDPVTPDDLRLTYSTELERQRLDARTKAGPQGYRHR